MTYCPKCKKYYKCSEHCRVWNSYEDKKEHIECICIRCTPVNRRATKGFLAKCNMEFKEKVIFT